MKVSHTGRFVLRNQRGEEKKKKRSNRTNEEYKRHSFKRAKVTWTIVRQCLWTAEVKLGSAGFEWAVDWWSDEETTDEPLKTRGGRNTDKKPCEKDQTVNWFILPSSRKKNKKKSPILERWRSVVLLVVADEAASVLAALSLPQEGLPDGLQLRQLQPHLLQVERAPVLDLPHGERVHVHERDAHQLPERGGGGREKFTFCWHWASGTFLLSWSRK